MALSSTTKVGFAFQSAFATAASNPVMAVPVDPPTFQLIYDVINDQTVRGDPVVDYNVYQGVKRVEASIDGPFYAEEIGYFLKALMGSEIFTSGSGTGTHVFHGLSQPSGGTFFVTDDVVVTTNSQRYIGASCTSFGVKFNAGEGILTYTSTWTGRDKPNGVTATTFPSFSTTLAPFLGWQADLVTSGGSATSWDTNVIDFEITVNRAPSLLYTANNTQLASRLDAGPIECTGRITADYTSIAQMDDFENNLEPNVQVILTKGSGATLKTLTIEIPKMHLLDSPLEIQRGGVSLAVQYGFRGVGLAAYKSPVKFTLVNSFNQAYT